MTIEILTRFFMWCVILNGSLYALSALVCILAPDCVYRIQARWFPLPRETYNAAIYGYFAVYKIVFLVFNLTPYVALLIIG